MKEGLWNLFLATGSIGAYMAYKNLTDCNGDFDNNCREGSAANKWR